MDERIHAHTCTFGEMMRHCFSSVRDNAFHYRLRVAIERQSEVKSCFLNAGHRKRFYHSLAQMRRANYNLISQIFLLSAHESLWHMVKKAIQRNGVDYTSFETEKQNFGAKENLLFVTALYFEYGSTHLSFMDLSDEEIVDFDVFRLICYAIAIRFYGMDAIELGERNYTRHMNHKRREMRVNE